MADIPDYYYDQQTCRYCRYPPAYVAYMTAHRHSPSTPSKQPPKPPPLSPTPYSKHHLHRTDHLSPFMRERQSLLNQLSSQQLRHDPFLPPSHSILFQTLLAGCKRRENATFDLPLSSEGPTLVASMRDIFVCHRGNLLVSVVRFADFKLLQVRDAIFVFDIVRSESGKKQLQVREDLELPMHVQLSPGRVVAMATCEGRHLLLTSSLGTVQAVWLDGSGPLVLMPYLSGDMTSCALWQVGSGLWGGVGLSSEAVITLRMVEGGREMVVSELAVCHSPAMSLAYAPENSLLIAGTRNGCLRFWDTRVGKRTMGSCSLPSGGARPSVMQLHPISDGRSVIANCMTSKLLLLDLRKLGSIVLQYPSYYNSDLHCRSTIDQSESCLAAMSCDRVLRIWSLRGGKLLRSIEESEYTGTEELHSGELPTISYADNFLGTGGRPSLLVGSHKGITALS